MKKFKVAAMLTISLVTGSAQGALTNGLVAYYPFYGNANDASGNNNNLAVYGATLCLDRFGVPNQAYFFNGSSYLGSSTVQLSQTGNWTVSAWVDPASLNSGNAYAVCVGYDNGSSGDGYALGISANNLYAFFAGVEFYSSGYALPSVNQWYHVVMLCNSGTTTFYVNGVVVGNSITATPITPIPNLTIGSATGIRFFNGAIDDVRIYNRALSSNEVAQLYTLESGPPVVITAQPTNVTANVGDMVSFSVTAGPAGTTLTYQWFKDGANIPNATNATLTLSDVQPSFIGNYSVSVAEFIGGSGVMSSAASLNLASVNSGLWQGLVAYYPFKGNANDATPIGNNLAVYGATLCPNRFGVPNQAYFFNGSSYLGSSTVPLSQTNNWTVVAWMNPASFTSMYAYAVCVGEDNGGYSGNGYALDISANQLYANFGNVGFYFSGYALPSVNQWYQVVVSCSSGTTMFYVNGVAVGYSITATPLAPTTSFTIGSATGIRFFNGAIDDVGIYNRALSSDEVAQLYAAQSKTTVVITAQPTNVIANIGDTVSFGVTATTTASTLTYQWFKEGVSIPNAASATLTISNVQPSFIGNYTVLVEDNGGGGALSSAASLSLAGFNSGLWQGLVAYYPFNGNANDASWNNNNLAVYGATLCPDRFGVPNQAYYFDGSSYLGSSTVQLSQTGNWTVSAWVDPASLNSGNAYAVCVGYDNGSSGDGYALGISANNLYAFFGGVGFYSSGCALPSVNQWYHVMMLCSSGTTTFYVNGVVVGNSITATPVTPIPNLTIGSATGIRFFNGAIDDVRIYNRALSSNEVAQLYALESTPDSAPFITIQPQNTIVPLGFPTNLTVTATGVAPLSYQWLFDGTNITSATNSSLAFATPQLTNAGIYSVVVTNSLGSITSSIAVLQVLPPDAPSIQANGVPVVGTMTFTNFVQVTLSDGFPDGYLFYTLDGSVPTVDSPFYTGAFTLLNSATIQAMSLSEDFSETSQAPPVTVQITPTYNLQLSVSGSGTINVNPASGPYASNSVVTLTANAAANWAFDYWTGNASGNQNPLSLTVNGPLSVQAIFLQTAYPLTASTPGGGSVTVNGQVISTAASYPAGSVVTLAATADPGWSFLGWQGNASGTNNPLNVTMNQTNNIQAIFGTVVGTNTLGGGSIVLSQPNPILYGTTLTVSAVPNAGKYFVAWSGAASGKNTPTTITVTRTNPTVNAFFTTLPGGEYSLGVVVLGNGTVAISPQQDYYDPNETVTLNASTTYPGTSFYGWTGGVSGTNNPIEMMMNSNIVVQANFKALPTVYISPQNQIVLGGSNAVLNANITLLPPLSYQWQSSEGAITGQTNATLTIVDAQATNSGNYTVVVSNSFGSVTSAVATVTVVFPPSISLQPANQTVVAGTSCTLVVSADGTSPFSFQWQNSTGTIPGLTNSSLILNPALTNYTDNYTVIVSNPYGDVTSHVASVFVYLPVSILAQPYSLVVPDSAMATFSVVASGFPDPISYQWTFNGTNLPGATSSSLNINHVSLANTGNYKVFVGNGYSSSNSTVATLKMSPSITSRFNGVTAILGQGTSISVGAIGSGDLGYQWYLNGVAIAGATSATLNFESIQFTNGGLYSVVVSSPYGSVTNMAQVVVNPAGVAIGFSPTLTISGEVGSSYMIQRSTNVADTNSWVTLTNLTLTQPVQIWVDTSIDASSPFNPLQFYRVLWGQ